jgi:hypothetical protein
MGERTMRRASLALIVGMAIALAAAGSAMADAAQLTVTRTDGQADPTADVARVFTLSGTSNTPQRVYVKHREPGGAGCAPSANSDSGDEAYWYGEQVNGNFKFQRAATWYDPGPELFCIWLATSSSAVVTPIPQTIDFRRAGGTITATITPAVPKPGQTMTAQISGSSEAPKSAYATIERAATPCAPTYASSIGSQLLSQSDVNGAFSYAATATAPSAGNYQLCLWLADSSTDAAPIAGPQAIPFAVVAPPKPCVVPSVARGAITLRTARKRLARKRCRVGAVRYVRSRTIRRGRVVRFSPKGPRRLSPNAAVTVIVSAGRRG